MTVGMGIGLFCLGMIVTLTVSYILLKNIDHKDKGDEE
jgi:hypothetical protein